MRVADAARAAFAIGFAEATALHPVQVTPRAKTTLAAAITLAEADQGHAESVVEATLILGQLEGVWAAIYDRRQKFLENGIAAVLGRWRKLEPDFSGLVHLVRRLNNLEETLAPPDPSVGALLAGLFTSVTSDAEMRDLLLEWTLQAEAEGKVGALALAADEAGAIGFDFDLAFDDALEALGGLESLTSPYWDTKAAEYFDRALSGTVNDLGRLLASMVQDGASYSEMLAGVCDLFQNGNAISYTVDVALSTGLTQGALNLYVSEGVTEVSFVTAGDARVCPMCDDAEAGSPYSPTDTSFPAPPLHGSCRCCLQAADISAALWQPYVTDNTD